MKRGDVSSSRAKEQPGGQVEPGGERSMLGRLEAIIQGRMGAFGSPARAKALAREVVEAMRSMTAPMLIAAQEASCTSGQIGHLRTQPASAILLADIYHAAIDAALSEGEK